MSSHPGSAAILAAPWLQRARRPRSQDEAPYRKTFVQVLMLDQLVTPAGPDEIARLGQTFNRMAEYVQVYAVQWSGHVAGHDCGPTTWSCSCHSP